jgi:hypothetical protein
MWNNSSRAVGGEASRRLSLPYPLQPVGSRWRSNLGRNGLSPVGIAAGKAEGLHTAQFTTTAKGEDQKVAGISGGAILTRERGEFR